MTKLLDPGPILAGLKPFQLSTVEYAFRRLYLDDDPTHRFLVADEVGLGKTLVARGIIAKTIEHLQDSIERIDILYVCSNSEIARQNVARLNVLPKRGFPLNSRITLLPTDIHGLRENRVNFVSITPGTSLQLSWGYGLWRERALLYAMLQRPWGLAGNPSFRVFQGQANLDLFRDSVKAFRQRYSIDGELEARFLRDLDTAERMSQERGEPTLRERYERLRDDYRFRFLPGRAGADDNHLQRRRHFINDLRRLLAYSCIDALEPDLIILDEFQRFKDLLSPDSEAGELVDALFSYQDEHRQTKVLLLSATPYKMYTRADDYSDVHYRDFLETYQFLAGPDERRRLQGELQAFRHELLAADGSDLGELQCAKERIELRLRRVMVRTERLAASDDRNGMLATRDAATYLAPDDVAAYLALGAVAEHLGVPDPLEYWRSAPYLLNFMQGYQLKRALERAREGGDKQLEALLARHQQQQLPLGTIRSYEPVEEQNAKLRWLLAWLRRGTWKLLWVPPALPYHQAGGVFAEPGVQGFTKRLIFSAWQVVPRAIASLVTYETERAIFRQAEVVPRNTPEARERRSALLRIAGSGEKRVGMSVLGFMYPSETLATLGDPLDYGGTVEGTLSPVDALLERIEARISARLAHLDHLAHDSLAPDESWYWLAPLLLDDQAEEGATRTWLSARTASAWSGAEGNTRWLEHVEHARERLVGPRLGRRPDDLAAVLALVALAGPGNVALRSLGRVISAAGDLKLASACIAWSFRSYFNAPEASAVIRGSTESSAPYWRLALRYAADGNLQAVLDEYLHMLWESQGLAHLERHNAVKKAVETVQEVLTLRTVPLQIDTLERDGEPLGMGGRFALPYGDARAAANPDVTRAASVRLAFNSPFLPHVLVSTSVGQEGLDFHTYCHAVVHWNLPSNPVDLEQREGRVHRYKNHAVRKNLASKLGRQLGTDDPWEELFARAAAALSDDGGGVSPYWIAEGVHKIERHVPALPLSREQQQLIELRRALVLYRMVFGQARQDDLIEYLLQYGERAEEIAKGLRIDLEPPPRSS